MFIYRLTSLFSFFFFNDTATTEIYTLSLHDALPISREYFGVRHRDAGRTRPRDSGPCERQPTPRSGRPPARDRSQIGKHTSELQSQSNLVCRLLLEKKKKKKTTTAHNLTASMKYATE